MSISEKFSRVLVWIGGTLIILSALLVTLEVILRKVFNVSLGGADELSGYAFGIATTFGFAYALFQRAHIRVDAAYNLFPSWLKLIADLVGLALLAGFAGLVAVMGWQLVADTITHNSHSITPLRTPLTLPQVPWLFGWIYFVFCAVLILVCALIALLQRDRKRAEQLISAKTLDEQVEEETV
ncbi:MAG: TRAP transporter small permease subunit [Pseudomonadota bacterium]